jgi:hypothetical protein
MTKHGMLVIDRFMRRVQVLDGPGACWQWLGGQSEGRGMFSVQGCAVMAARWSFLHHVGPVAAGDVVRAACGNKLCVRPEHLEAVTFALSCRLGQMGRGRRDRHSGRDAPPRHS